MTQTQKNSTEKPGKQGTGKGILSLSLKIRRFKRSGKVADNTK